MKRTPNPVSLRCDYCGRESPEGSVACRECGTPLTTTVPESTRAPDKKVQCIKCGIESDFEAGFLKGRGLNITYQDRRYCPPCWSRMKLHEQKVSLYWLLAMGIVGALMIATEVIEPVGRLSFGLFLFYAFMYLSLLPHELGHALAARLAGWKVFGVTVGIGKPLWTRKFGDVTFTLNAFPTLGWVSMGAMEPRLYRLKFFLIVLAGPLVHAGIVAVILFMLYRNGIRITDWENIPPVVLVLGLANVTLLVYNLWPHTPALFPQGNDGKLLLNTLSMKPEAVREACATRFVCEALLCLQRQDDSGTQEWVKRGLAIYPGNIHLLNLQGVVLIQGRNFEAARQIYIELLEKNPTEDMYRFLLLNNLAYVDVMLAREDLLPEADNYSKRVYKMVPWFPWAAGTRGAAVIAMGQFQEGLDLAKKAYSEATDVRSKAQNACWAAIAEAQLGNHAAAETLLTEARQLDPNCCVLDRAERVIGHSETRSRS